jgi:hypothetical protein
LFFPDERDGGIAIVPDSPSAATMMRATSLYRLSRFQVGTQSPHRRTDRYQRVVNLPDKQIARYLSETIEEKAGAVEPMKLGDERAVLEASLPIVEALNSWCESAPNIDPTLERSINGL